MSATSVSDPLVGHLLDGRYEVLAKLARGGMATVYRARDTRLTRTVALKVMRSDLGDDEEFVAKFDREARSAATLCHPNVVGVFDRGTAAGKPYIVMEFIEGQTLRHLVSSEAPLHPKRVLDLIEPIASALAAAHETGLVHRDIKPENVLLSSRGQVKVADFGLARLMDASPMTATGVLVGTASYLPPELVMHSRPDTRSDVYSTGVMVFEMLTGRKPHVGDNNYQIAYAHVNVDIPSPNEAIEQYGIDTPWHIPDYLDAFVHACTRRSPDLRPSDASVMVSMLRRIRYAMDARRRDDPALAAEFRSLATEPDTDDVTVTLSPSAVPQTMHPAPEKVGRTWKPRDGATAATRFGVAASTPVSPIDYENSLSGPSARADEPKPVLQRTPVFAGYSFSNEAKYRRRRGIVAALALLIVALVVGVGAWWWAEGRYVSAPALVNTTRSDAEAVASANGLTLALDQEYSENVAKGLITRTSPEAGTKLLRNATLHAWVSLGPERYEVPKLAGMLRDEAAAALQTQHLAVGSVSEAFAEDVAAGRVVSSSQQAGAMLKKNTKIDLVVSKGPKPIPISNYAGKPAATATSELEKAGFKVTSTEENHRSVAKGSVISQAPNSGTGKRGDAVKLVVSKGPVMLKVPSFLPLIQATDAQAELERAGFATEVSFNSPTIHLGILSHTTPAAGTLVPEGSTITLHVS